jgi:hypothetical protein
MINRLSGAIMIAGAAAIMIGLPLFACIRDAKALRSQAPICHASETLSECLPPLPPVPETELAAATA